jgi:hypothetical protein
MSSPLHLFLEGYVAGLANDYSDRRFDRALLAAGAGVRELPAEANPFDHITTQLDPWVRGYIQGVRHALRPQHHTTSPPLTHGQGHFH